MKASIFDLEKVKAEVARRQRNCHKAGVSYVAFDQAHGAVIEYLPNGNELVMAQSEQLPINAQANLNKKKSALKVRQAKSRRAILRKKKKEDENGIVGNTKRAGSI